MAQPLGARTLGPCAAVLGTYQWALAHPLGAPKPCCLKENRWAWQHMWARGDACVGTRCYRLEPPNALPNSLSPAQVTSLTAPRTDARLRTFQTFLFYYLFSRLFSFGVRIKLKCKTVETAFRCKTKRVMCHACNAHFSLRYFLWSDRES